MFDYSGDDPRARCAALDQLVEIMLAHASDGVLALEEGRCWADAHATFESMLRAEVGDEEAEWYLGAADAARVRRHLSKMGAQKLTALTHNSAVALSKLPPEHQLAVWLKAVTAKRTDYGTIKMAVERLLARPTGDNSEKQ